MSTNIIQNKVRPNLTNNEKSRYKMAAEHFMRGASDFYVEHYFHVKKIVDIHAIRDKLQENYNQVIDDFKNKIKEKADVLAQQAKDGISKAIDNILTAANIIALAMLPFKDKIGDIFIKLKKVYEPLTSTIGDAFDKFVDFLQGNVFQGISIKEDLQRTFGIFQDYSVKFLKILFEGVDEFLTKQSDPNGILWEMINGAAIAGFNRAFDSSFGKYLGWLFSRIDLKVRARPDLYEFCKMGAETYEKVSTVSGIMGTVSQDVVRWDENFNFAEGWVHVERRQNADGSRYTHWSVIANNEAGATKFRDQMNNFHLRFTQIASQLVRNSPLTNPFEEINPLTSDAYRRAEQELYTFTQSTIAVDGAFYSRDRKIQFLQYKGDDLNPLVASLEAYSRRYANSTNSDIRLAVARWARLKDIIEFNKKEYNHYYNGTTNKQGYSDTYTGINVDVAYRMYLLYLVFVSFERRFIMSDIRNFELDAHNFKQDSELNYTLSMLKGIRENVENHNFTILTSIKDADTLFKSMIYRPRLEQLNETIPYGHKSFNLFSDLMFDDLFDGQFSTYVISNKILSIKDELLRLKYIRMGFQSHNIYNFNNYSEGTDYAVRTIDLNLTDEQRRQGYSYRWRMEGNQIQNSMTNVEISKRLVEEWANAKIVELQIRRTRLHIINSIIRIVTELRDLYPKRNEA